MLTGPSGQPALDNVSLRPSEAMMRRTRLRPPDPHQSPEVAATSTRRALLAEFGAAALAIAGISTLAKGSYTAARTLTAGGKGKGGTGGGSAASNSGASTPASNAKVPARRGKARPPANRLPKGQAATYSDPADGSPDILIRGSDGSLKAFSAVCTHAGCTVGYENGTIICPCHGGEYSAETGEVIAGPPPAPLEPKKVVERAGRSTRYPRSPRVRPPIGAGPLQAAPNPLPMSTNRLEAFSDGVFAIAITLLVLEIRVPEPGAGESLGHELLAQWPSYAAFVVSFLTIGIIWINHHAMVRRLRRRRPLDPDLEPACC